jgi:hypothetical protein
MNKLILLVAITSAALFGSCRKQALPNDITIGTFKGKLAYKDASGVYITAGQGTAKVSGYEGNYVIKFSNEVPAINGVSFERTGNATYTVSKTENAGAKGIVLTDETLTVKIFGFRGANWSFQGTK